MINNKWVADGQFSPYSDIQLESADLNRISSMSSNEDIYKKLHKITEARLSIEVAKWTLTKEQFEWAMLYWKYLNKYFKQ